MSARAAFTRMDQSQPAGWEIIREETWRGQARVADRVLGLLRGLAEIHDGFAVDQLTHCLQTAARAEAAGASDELILAALCHDAGKAISVFGHAAIGSAILQPYVSADVTWLLANHQLIQQRHYATYFGGKPDAWHALREHPVFPTAWRFVEEWDQAAFDPSYPTPPLARYEPLVRTWFARPARRG